MHINKVFLYGHITKDLDLKATKGGTNVLSFSIGTNRKWKDKNGEMQEDAQFHNCVAWGKTGELISKFLGKGSGIWIEGRLQTRQYEAKDGSKRYVTEVVVENMQFGPKSGGSATGGKVESALEEVPTINIDEEIRAEDLPF